GGNVRRRRAEAVAAVEGACGRIGGCGMTDRRLPDYLLERLALGELPEEAARAAQEQLAREPGGAQRLDDLRDLDAELLARHPPQAAAAEIARRQRAVGVRLGRRRAAWLTASAGGVPRGGVA